MVFGPHVRLSFSGTLGLALPPPELFTFTLSLDRASNISQAQCDAVAAAGVTLFGDVDARIHVNAKLREVKAALIGPTGAYAAFPPVMSMVNQSGASAIADREPQLALAVSLDTIVRGVRGRFYLPMPDMRIENNNLLMTVADATTAIGSYKTFLNAVNSAVGAGIGGSAGICVASRKGTGNNAIVRGLRVGRAKDTIRSRRRSLDESYVVATLP